MTKADIAAGSPTNDIQKMKLLEYTDLRRFGIQLAARDEWEHCFGVDEASSQGAKEWVAAAGSDIAIESLFCDGSGELRGFIGFRRSLERARDRCAFWLDVLERTKPLELNGPQEHVAAWLEILGQPSLLDDPAQGIELGVFNQWRSAGPVRLRLARLTEDDLRHGPDWVRQGATSPICCEHQWVAPAEFWIAYVVSHKEQGRYVLDPWLLPQ